MQTPETPTSPADPGFATNGTALRFLSFGLLSLACASVWLALRPEMLLSATPKPEGMAWMYLLVVGFLFSMGFGAFYALAPAALEVPPSRPGFAISHFVIHVFCTLLLLPLFAAANDGWVKKSWLLLYVLPLAFVLPIFCKLQSGRSRSVASAFVNAAVFWLVLLILGAALLSADHFAPFVRSANWLAGSFQMLLAGVFVNLLLGVLLPLLPMTARGPRPLPGLPTIAFVFVNLGIAALYFAAALAPGPVIAGCAAVFLAGILVYDAEIYSRYRSGDLRGISQGTRAAITAVILIVPCGLIGAASPWGADFLPESSQVIHTSYILAGLLGVAGFAAAGLFQELFSRVLGRRSPDAKPDEPGPLPASIQVAGYVNHLVGVSLMVPGLWIGSEKVVSLGAFFFLMGVIALLANVLLSYRACQIAPSPFAPAPAHTL